MNDMLSLLEMRQLATADMALNWLIINNSYVLSQVHFSFCDIIHKKVNEVTAEKGITWVTFTDMHAT